MIRTYLLHPLFFCQVCRGLKLKRVDRAYSGYTWLLELSEIRSPCEEKVDWMIRLRQESESWTRERFLLCSLEMGSGKGRRINEEGGQADKDTRNPTWQLTPEIEDNRIVESVKIARWSWIRAKERRDDVNSKKKRYSSSFSSFYLRNHKRWKVRIASLWRRNIVCFRSVSKEKSQNARFQIKLFETFELVRAIIVLLKLYYTTSNYSNYSEEYSNTIEWLKR